MLVESLSEAQRKPYGVLSVDDTLLTHYGEHFEGIAYLYDHGEQHYVWAHNLVTLHYSDDVTDYPLLFQLWKPVDLDKLETGLVAAGIKLKDSKQVLKTDEYTLRLWRRHQKQPEVAALYDSKLTIAQDLLVQWAKKQHLNEKSPVAFDTWYTQPAFCHDLDQQGSVRWVAKKP